MLFLDEVSEIPLPMQVKLLRFLQEREQHLTCLSPAPCPPPREVSLPEMTPLPEMTLAQLERIAIKQALHRAAGSTAQAARARSHPTATPNASMLAAQSGVG